MAYYVSDRVRTVRRTLSLTEHCEWARPGQRVDEAARDERVDERAQLRVGLRDLHDAAEGAEVRRRFENRGSATSPVTRVGPRAARRGARRGRGDSLLGLRRGEGRGGEGDDGTLRMVAEEDVDLCQSYVARDDDKLRCQ